MSRLMSLTPEQRAALDVHADEWITYGLRTEPLTEAEWAAWEAGARECYRLAGIDWPGVVVRVPSPIVGAFAAPIASVVIARLRRDAVRDAAHGAVRDAVGGAVSDAVGGAVSDAVGDAVSGAVSGAVGGAVSDAVGDAVGGAVSDAVGDAVHGAVHGAVRDAVGGAVGDAVRGAWWRYLGGRAWAAWTAWLTSYLDCLDNPTTPLDVPTDTWHKLDAWEAANSAGHWWPTRDFVMVSALPGAIHLEQVGPRGRGSHRLHREDGPALAYDGWSIYYWHGVRVPADLIEVGWSTDRILAEPNTEIRRCAIERMGWDAFVDAAGLTQVGDAVDDPGNPGHTLTLHDVPSAIYGEPVRVLLCTNGTVERDGTRRRFGLTVPATCRTPLDAAAWTYDLTPQQYATAQRRA